METKYVVKFSYYQYNTGYADNGTYHTEKEFDNILDAKEFFNKIDEAVIAMENQEYEINYYNWGCDLVFELFGVSGYLIYEPELHKIESEIQITKIL